MDPEVRQIGSAALLCSPLSRSVSSVLPSGKWGGNNTGIYHVNPLQGLYMTHTKYLGLCRERSRGLEVVLKETKSPQMIVCSLTTDIRQLNPHKTCSVAMFSSSFLHEPVIPVCPSTEYVLIIHSWPVRTKCLLVLHLRSAMCDYRLNTSILMIMMMTVTAALIMAKRWQITCNAKLAQGGAAFP